MKKVMTIGVIVGIILVFSPASANAIMWEGIDWEIWGTPPTVNADGYLELQDAVVHYSTSEAFRASATPWVEVSFIDVPSSEVPNGFRLEIEDDTPADGTSQGGAWIECGGFNRKKSKGVPDTNNHYYICLQDYDSGLGEWFVTSFTRSEGEHTMRVGMRSDSTIDFWFDGDLLHSSTIATPNYFGDVYMNADDDTTVITSYRAGTDYSLYLPVTETLDDAKETIDELDVESLKNPNLKIAFTKKINAVFELIDEGFYEDALDKLKHDILQKTNGCADTGEPDRNDWIITCEGQDKVYPLIMAAIELLEVLI